MTERPIIQAWVDRHGRVWLDSGTYATTARLPVIELLNGAARGTVEWVTHEFGPLRQLGVQQLGDEADRQE